MYTWTDKTTVYTNSKVTRRALSVLGQCGHMIILDPFLSRHIPTLLFIPRDFCPRKSTFQCCFYAAWALNVSLYLRIFSDFTWRCSVLKVNLPVALHNPAAVSAMQVWVSVSLCLSISLFFFFLSPLSLPWIRYLFLHPGFSVVLWRRRIIILLVGENRFDKVFPIKQ